MARDAENLLQLSPKVLFQRRAKRSSQRAETECCTSSVQTILCSGRSVTYRCHNLNEISTHSKRVDCGFNSSWNGLDKQSSAEPNIILNFPSDTSFKQPSLFVQAAYNLIACEQALVWVLCARCETRVAKLREIGRASCRERV